MLRNLNRTLPTGRVLGTPWVGLPAAQIAADTATGDHGPGILYNEAVQPEFAGQRLRAEVQNWPPVGTLRVHEDGSFEIDGLPDGLHTFAYRVYADGALAGETAFEVRVGARDAEAPGMVLASSAALVAGGAIGGTLVQGVTLTSAATLTAGRATGGALASGTTLASTTTLTAGNASGGATAIGAALASTTTLLTGVASGGALANGTTLSSAAALLAGSATGGTLAAGATLHASSALIPCAAAARIFRGNF